MNRRDFLRRAALVAAGAVAADQLDLLERLAPKRLWAGHSFNEPTIQVWKEKADFYGISGLHLGDHVAYVRSGALVTNSIATVTSISPLTLTFNSRFRGAHANDTIVMVNSEIVPSQTRRRRGRI